LTFDRSVGTCRAFASCGPCRAKCLELLVDRDYIRVPVGVPQHQVGELLLQATDPFVELARSEL
jgi:hypothetical protein